MRILTTNAAMLSSFRSGGTAPDGGQLFLSSEVWESIFRKDADLICLDEVRPGCNSNLWEERIERLHERSYAVHIPTNTSRVALCWKKHSINVSLRTGVPQFDGAATWWIFLDNMLTAAEVGEHDKISLTIVYAPAEHTSRREFFNDQLVHLMRNLQSINEDLQDLGDIPCIITGDFNDFPSELDRRTKPFTGCR